MNDATFTAIFHIEVFAENADDETVCVYREFYVIQDIWANDAHDRADSRAFCLNRTYNGDYAFADRILYVD